MPKALVIDDDPVVAKAVHRLLLQVLPATWAVQHETEAPLGLSRAVVDRNVELVFVDLIMPGMDGNTLIEKALANRPTLSGRIVVCSGAWLKAEQEQRLFIELGCVRLDKPFRLETLEHAVWSVIGR